MVTIFHLSDLHIVTSAHWNNLRRCILDEARRIEGEKILVLTGDFHNYYRDSNYDKAKAFLEELFDALGVNPAKDVFAIPGNHDVGNPTTMERRFPGEEWAFRQNNAVEWLKTHNAADKFYSRNVEERLASYAPYCAFVRELGIYPDGGDEYLPARVHVRCWRGRLNILHLNTTLVAAGQAERAEQVDILGATDPEIWKDADGSLPALALGHNSFYDLVNDMGKGQLHQRSLVLPFAKNGVCAYLCGDTHAEEIDPNRQIVRLDYGFSDRVDTIPNAVGVKGAADERDTFSDFGLYLHEWDEGGGTVKQTLLRWKPDRTQAAFSRENAGQYGMPHGKARDKHPSSIRVSFNNLNNKMFRKCVASLGNNAYLSTKEETEDPTRFPLEQKFGGIDHITLLNYAGTSFLRSAYIASVYQGNDEYARWFFDSLRNGSLEADVILTDPNSYAAKDAAMYKMYPRGRSVNTDEIIQLNINVLLDFKKRNPHARVNLYLTDICLPYGIMLGESYVDPTRNFMKIDLYSPLTYDDFNRPSLYLLAENKNTERLYGIFRQVITNVLSDERTRNRYSGRDTSWLLERPIIHRGRIRNDLPEHSIKGYWECIKRGFPMEVDILVLKDGVPIVGRDGRFASQKWSTDFNRSFYLSDLTIEELRHLSSDDCRDTSGNPLRFQFEELMTLEELLSLVDGSVGLLIEIKEDADSPEAMIQRNVKIILDKLRYYRGKYAVHSSNPRVLEAFRAHNPMVPLGLISWSFSGVSIPQRYRDIHSTLSFDDIGQPDFISYKLSEIAGNKSLKTLRKNHKLPILAWTICSEEDEVKAKRRRIEVDNIIIEGASSFLNQN